MSKRQSPFIKAGKLLALSRGAYSDYCVDGFHVALRDIDFAAALDEYLAEAQAKEPWQASDYFECDKFTAFLIRGGYLLAVDYSEVHLGDYGQTPNWCDK